eukprot:gene691-738_t
MLPRVSSRIAPLGIRFMTTSAKKKVALVGFLPQKLDLTNFPDLTAEKIHAGLIADVEAISKKGLDCQLIYVDPTDFNSTAALVKELPKLDIVLIGAGIRTLPPFFLYFEKLINLIHENSRPSTRICFNTSPFDSADAVARWA